MLNWSIDSERGSLERAFGRSIKLKKFFVVLAVSVFLTACGEQKVENQQADIKMEKQDAKISEPEVVKPDVVETDNSLLENTATVSGDITYEGQAVLPENARLVVYLVDTSKPGNGVSALMSGSYILEGPPPYSYELNYEKSLINEQGSYALRAVIRLGKEPLFRGAKTLSLFPETDVALSLNLVEVKEE